jgi:hypothetical protein
VTYCDLPGDPAFLTGLTGPLSVRVADHMNHDLPPGELEGLLRGPLALCNLLEVTDQLALRFGAGRDTSVSNTIERTWGDGHLEIRVRVFPPEMNRQSAVNERHAKVPGSATECAVIIRPDWWPPPSDTESGWLRSFVPRPDWGVPYSLPAWCDTVSRPCPATFGNLQRGLGLSKDRTCLIAVHGNGRLAFWPVRHIVGLRHQIGHPARGGGWSGVDLVLRLPGVPSPQPRHVTLRKGAHDDPGQGQFAASLAMTLGLCVDLQEFDDD